MKLLYTLRWGSLLLAGACSAPQAQVSKPAATHAIKVYSHGYRGLLSISGAENQFYLPGDTVLTLFPNNEDAYYLNTGATIGDCKSVTTSYIFCFFGKDGLLDSVCPAASAYKGKDRRSIHLKTAPINIDAGQFNRDWNPTFGSPPFKHRRYYRGSQKNIMLVTGQTYAIDNAHVSIFYADRDNHRVEHPSYFNFTVTASGQIALHDTIHLAAQAEQNTLRLKSVKAVLDPQEISKGKPLQLHNLDGHTDVITSPTEFMFLRGVASAVDWTDDKGQIRHFVFLPL